MKVPESQNHPVTECFNSNINYAMIKNITYLEHAHPSYELIFVQKGVVHVFTHQQNYVVTEGSLLFISSDVIHAYTSSFDSVSFVIGCMPNEVPQFHAAVENSGYSIFSLQNSESTQPLNDIVKSLYANSTASQNRVALVGYISLVLSYIATELEKSPPQPNIQKHISSLERALIHIGNMHYINQNIEQVANTLGISKFHLSRLFNKQLGVSYNTYISLMRINASRRMLIQTNLPISEIYSRCGYKNARSFDRDFLKLVEITPREYRKLHKDEGMSNYYTPFVQNLLCERYNCTPPKNS